MTIEDAQTRTFVFDADPEKVVFERRGAELEDVFRTTRRGGLELVENLLSVIFEHPYGVSAESETLCVRRL